MHKYKVSVLKATIENKTSSVTSRFKKVTTVKQAARMPEIQNTRFVSEISGLLLLYSVGPRYNNL